MTVANNYAPVVTAANGVATQFSGAWNAISASYLVVQLLNTATGVYTTVSQGAGANQYQVTTLTSSGFTITFNTAPATGNDVVISRSTTPQQTIPYTTSRGFQGSVEEGSFDELTNMVQELLDLASNAIQVPVGDTATNLILPIASLRANQGLIFDASGNVTVGQIASAPVSAAMQPVVAASTLAAARTAMGLDTMATQNAGAVAITGGAVDGTTIGGTTPAPASVTSMNAGQLAGFRNALINGSFLKWDYGTSYTLTSSIAYGSANRWAVAGPNTAGIFNQDTSITTGLGFQYNAKLGRNSSSASTTPIQMVQALESVNSIPLAGQQVTLSYYAKAGANYSSASNALSVKLSTGTGTDQSAVNLAAGSWTGAANAIAATDTLTTSWQRFSHTVTLGSSIKQLGVQFGYTPSGTAGADDNVYITGVQLEPGPAATPFEQRGIGVENLLCARYLPVWRSDSTNYNIGSCDFSASTNLLCHLNLATPARVDPTGIVASGTGIIGAGVAGTAFTSTAIALGNASNLFIKVNATTSGGTAGQGGQLYLNASGAYIYATGCEL